MFLNRSKVRVLINEDDKSRFEYMLEQFQFLIRDIEATPLELTNNHKDYECVIAVTKHSHFELLIEVLKTNGFGIQTNDKKVKDILDKLNSKYLGEISEFISTIEVKKNVNKTHPGLDKLVSDGNYTELIKIAKDITYSPETIVKARTGISRAITNYIIKTIENVSKYKIDIAEAVKILLAIAIDTDLKYFKHDELMMQAADVAFEICTKDPDSITNLIKIANQKNVDYLLNLKAASKFAEIALVDEYKYKSQLKQATKDLNIRWLINLLDLFPDKIEQEEKENIEKLISYIKNYFAA